VPFVLLYPVIWGVFTIWRGSLIGWYPYYFLDARQVSGLVEMAVTCAIALSIFALVASGLVLLSRVSVTVRDAAAQPSSSRPAQPSLSPSSSGAK